MLDKDNEELAVGDLIEVLEIHDGLRQMVGDEDYEQLLKMKGSLLEIEEITEDGYATVGIWIHEGEGRAAYHGLSLLPHECRRVEWTIGALPLHDLAFETMEFRWEAGSVALRFKRESPPSRLLTFTGVGSLELSRNFPWGRSSSVNSIRQTAEDRFDIEMQSGDVVGIRAASWSFAFDSSG